MQTTTIEIATTTHALIVRGEVPIGLLRGIAQYASEFGWDRLDVDMAQALDATLVITNAAGMAAMRAGHDVCPVAGPDRGNDRGGTDGTTQRTV